MTGWTANQAGMGEPVQRVFHIVNEQTGQPMEDFVGRILLDGGPVPLAEHAALVTKNGATLPVEDSASPILDAKGKVIGVALVFQYVTEKRRTQEAMQKYRATLEQRAVERTAMAKTQAMQLRQVALELSDTEERERKRYASMLFRSVKELLFNAVKHSGTDSALVEAHNGNSRIRIRVTDQGKGCDPSVFRKEDGKMTGFGLFNIEERIRCLGGRFEFKSSPEGNGCRVTIEIPKS